MKIEVSVLRDLLQQHSGNLKVPEIRIWCHPHAVEKKGEDYYVVVDSFKEATDFIENHPEAEKQPLIAFRGYEINLFTIEGVTWEK